MLRAGVGLGLQLARDVRLYPGVSYQAEFGGINPQIGLGSVVTAAGRRLPLIQVRLSGPLMLDGYLSAHRGDQGWLWTSGLGLTFRVGRERKDE